MLIAGRRSSGRCLLLGYALASAACGARTGLLAPDPPASRCDGGDCTLPASPAPPRTSVCVRVTGETGSTATEPPPIELRVAPRVRDADVVLLIDRTASMSEEIDAIRQNLLGAIVPGVRAAVPDAQFAVASFGEFPVAPYGGRADSPFTLHAPVTDRVGPLTFALAQLAARDGGDVPEATVEALFQLATGAGYAPWIAPSAACASGSAPGDPVPRGAACLRPDAQPLVLLVTDAPMHNGPAGHAYRDADFTASAARGPRTYDEALRALAATGAAVVGISSAAPDVPPTLSPRPDLEQVARDTGALDPAGAPLVFDIGPDGRGLDRRVVDAVRAFVASGRLEVSARLTELDGAAVDPSALPPLRPLRAEPATGASWFDASAFHGALPGTSLVFALALPPPAARGYAPPTERRARVQFYANNRPSLGTVDVRIVTWPPSAMDQTRTTDPCASPELPARDQ